VELCRYFVSQSSEFCRHNTLCCFSTSVYCCKSTFLYRLNPETFWIHPLIAPRFFELGTGWRWVVSFMPWSLYSQGNGPGTHLIGSWVCTRVGLLLDYDGFSRHSASSLTRGRVFQFLCEVHNCWHAYEDTNKDKKWLSWSVNHLFLLGCSESLGPHYSYSPNHYRFNKHVMSCFLVPEDHARGLSTFTIMAGLGGFLGYALGAINWDATTLGRWKPNG
jgi:hypothetical protein